MDYQEIAHQQELVSEYTKVLRVLEKQAARFGIHVPPHIEIEIEEVTAKITKLNREIINFQNRRNRQFLTIRSRIWYPI